MTKCCLLCIHNYILPYTMISRTMLRMISKATATPTTNITAPRPLVDRPDVDATPSVYVALVTMMSSPSLSVRENGVCLMIRLAMTKAVSEPSSEEYSMTAL